MQRIWITDGSPVRFRDTYRLRATHPALLGLRASYEGLVDPAVYVGSATIEGERPDDRLYAEAEWCLSFPHGMRPYLEETARLQPTTPVVMQGLIEGKWLNRLLGTGAWGPATLGNNLLAEGPGIPTTIGAIEAGAQGEVGVSYQYQRAAQTQTQAHHTTLADLRGQNIIGLVRDVLGLCHEMRDEIDGIDLSAMGESAAVVTESRRIRAAMRLGFLPLPNLWYLLARHRAMERLVRGILTEEASVPPGVPVSITTRDEQGRVVGQGRLTWQAGAGEDAKPAGRHQGNAHVP